MTKAKLLLDSAYDGIKVKSFSVASELLSKANSLGVSAVFVYSELKIVMILEGFLLECKLGSSTPLLHCWKYSQC